MRGTRYKGRSGAGWPSRVRLVAVTMGLFLLVGQAIGVIAANAGSGLSSGSLVGNLTGAARLGGGGTTKLHRSGAALSLKAARQLAATSNTSLNVDLDQWANLPGKGWQNGDLNGNNSAYNEGEVVPFRLAIEGLSPGKHTIHINYDFTAGGHEAYDFLATYDATESPGLCASGGGGVSSLCGGGLPSPDTATFPSDPFAPGSPTKAGLTVAGAEAFSGVPRQLTLFGGSIDSISGPTHSGPTNNNSSADFEVKFTSDGSAVLLAWGGHLAESAYWKRTNGSNNGASMVSGAPWHMRTQSLDGSGNKNQDRSIQPSAVVPLPGLQIVKSASSSQVGLGETFAYTITVTNTGDATASPVIITDDLPDSLTGVSATYDIDPGSGQDGTCSVSAGNVVSCPSSGAISLAKSDGDTTPPENDVVAVTITAMAPADSCPTLVNTATAQIGDAAAVSSNQVTVDVTGCSVDLALTKTSDVGGAATPGDTATYTIVVTNNGTVAAKDVTVTDTVPSGLSIDGASFTGGSKGPGTCDVSGQDVSCDIGTLASGAKATVTIDFTVHAGACPAVTNSASVSASNETGSLADNTDSTSFDVNCALSVTVVKTNDANGDGTFQDAETAGAPGQDVAFEAVVTNTSDVPVEVTSFTDEWPGTAPFDIQCDDGEGTSSLVGTTLAAGASVTCDFTVTDYSPTWGSSVTNTVNVEVSAFEDTATDSDTSTVDTPALHPAIQIVKTASTHVISPGDTVTYTYDVTNTGDTTLFNVTVDDNKLGHICDIPVLAVGETQSCTADFTAAEANVGPVDNIGTAVGTDVAGEQVHDSDTESIDVVLGKTVTPPTTTPPGGTAFTGTSAAIPLAALALAFLVAGSGLLYLSRRRREDGSEA